MSEPLYTVGRHVAIQTWSGKGERYVCGSERAVTAAVRRIIYNKTCLTSVARSDFLCTAMRREKA